MDEREIIGFILLLQISGVELILIRKPVHKRLFSFFLTQLESKLAQSPNGEIMFSDLSQKAIV